MAKGGKRPGAGRKSKADEERIRELTSPHVPGAIKAVVDIMNNPDSEDRDKISAAKLMLSYAWGTPKQQISADVSLREVLVEFAEDEG